jgi:glycosyltransferase involved in cell wall biosynthesis
MGNSSNQPLVSILMPVLNGEYFLPQSLDSLLAQDYHHLEIIILDNLSTDATPEICQRYAEKDRRIRYIRDVFSRDPNEAAGHLATLARGEYCFPAGDDDLWEPNFISRLLPVIMADLEIGLVYCNADYVDMAGKFYGDRVLEPKKLYRRTRDRFNNCWDYLFHRQIMPMTFGIFRTSYYQQSMPVENFDRAIKNADVLWVFKFLTMFKVDSVDDILFHYRQKFRWEYHFVMGDHRKEVSVWNIVLFEARHQWLFF